MNELIKKIMVGNKRRLYFVSPHLDDAILSCGSLIHKLVNDFSITVINVFTEISSPPFTFSAKAFMKQCNRYDACEFFKERKEEDCNALNSLGVEVKNLGFIDAQWRKKEKLNFIQKKLSFLLPEIMHVYPVYRWHIVNGKISNFDTKMISDIKNRILGIVGSDKNYLIFCPIAIGGNVDHRIVRNCCLDIFDNNVVLWSDFPYNIKNRSDFENISNYKEFIFDSNDSQKEKLIRMYKSQYEALVNDGMTKLTEERYYLRN